MSRRFAYGQYYHIFNKSIAGYTIFPQQDDFYRWTRLVAYFNNLNNRISPSKWFKRFPGDDYSSNLYSESTKNPIFIIAYCFMPTHYHLLCKICIESRISKYINNVENSYTRYFNIKYHRKGPLWQSRFKCVQVKTDAQLLHTSRYIHLNPCSSSLVENPEDWVYSSYKDYVKENSILEEKLDCYLTRDRNRYAQFVNNRKDFQRKLHYIRKIVLE